MKMLKTPFEWQRFLSGEWQQTMPTKAGNYPIADRMGNHSGYNIVVINKGVPQAVKDWGGWWWSQPQPYLLRPPQRWDNE